MKPHEYLCKQLKLIATNKPWNFKLKSNANHTQNKWNFYYFISILNILKKIIADNSDCKRKFKVIHIENEKRWYYFI